MRYTLLLLIVGLLLASCEFKEKYDSDVVLSSAPIIPKPTKIENGDGHHLLGRLVLPESKVPTQDLVESWSEKQSIHRPSEVTFVQKEMESEAYRLDISDEEITITAAGNYGYYWGLVTLQQVVELGADSTRQGWVIPTGTIVDAPSYGYRGMMLDISRHYFGPDEIKLIIDEITRYKINRLHLHLADDQGWRIEIKSWPKLTKIGGLTEVGGGEGGFLSQEDYRDLVAYATKRNIVIIPEIDMPGHTNAALASYAELNCDDVARELYTGIEVGFSTLCTSKEITYQFVEDVVREISSISPGPWFHIGGDESMVTKEEDYRYFIERVYGIVRKHGKKMIGWDEVGETNIGDQAVVQLWRHDEKAMKGISKGAKVLFSPAWRAYLDMKYDSSTQLGLVWAGFIDLGVAYNWDPTDYISEEYRSSFLGLEAPLWSETVTNVDECEYLIFPRLTAYSEIGWTPKADRGFEDFEARVTAHQQWWKELGIDAYLGN